jgi:hypothetical protein
MRTTRLMLACLLLAACDGTAPLDGGMDAPSTRDVPDIDAWFPPVPDDPISAANALSPGDPLFEGQQRFLYDTFGTERLDAWPPAEFMVGLMSAEPAVFGNQFESFGFIPDPDRDLPYGFVRGIEDPSRVHETCALCHVGRLPDGTLWIGLPNRALDFTRFRYEVSQRWEAAGHAPLLSATEAAKALAYGPGRTGAESGDYPDPVPADFPPYWLLGERTATNYLGTGGNLRSEVFLAVFSLGAGSPNDRDAVVPFPSSARLDPMIDFMASIGSAPAPAGDAVAIEAGRLIYERERCGTCHHLDDIAMNGVVTYDRAEPGMERFPGDDAAFPRGSIRTSYPHRILIDGLPDPAIDGGLDVDAGSVDAGSGDDGRLDLIRFISRNRLRVSSSDGYRVDDLHGLWTTAPYLHNGSVPTLEDLLRPAAERPLTFMRGDFVVDTTLPGNSNQGHEFGTGISDAERTALVAYLNSL